MDPVTMFLSNLYAVSTLATAYLAPIALVLGILCAYFHIRWTLRAVKMLDHLERQSR